MSNEIDYYGTKFVTAWPHGKLRFNDATGKHETDEGYAVRYEGGYESWSPKAVFEAAYKPVTAMDFSGALAAMKDGHKVVRGIWVEFYGDEAVCLIMVKDDRGEDRIGLVYADPAFNDHDDNWLDWRTSVDSGDLMATDWQIWQKPEEAGTVAPES